MSVRLRRTVVVAKPREEVFRYLADFTTTTEWDPATVRTVRLHGDGGVGTTYRNTSTFLGREAQLDYRVVDLRPDDVIQLRGENRTLVALDTITLRQLSDATEVTYTAEFALKGAGRLVAPLLRPAFRKLGNDAESGLRSALEQL